MSPTGEVEKPTEEKKAAPSAGELLFCGATSWDNVGRRNGAALGENLPSPTRLRPLVNVDIRFVASGCVSCHCVALDVQGRCYTWGRNEKGQLGHGDTLQRDRPTVVSDLLKHKVVKAGAGRNHTVVVTEDGNSFAFGWNKHGQLGSGSLKNEVEMSPVRCLTSQATNAVCGADFTVWLTSIEGSSILTAGLPQYGQLGHGTDNEYNVKDASVKLAYEAQPRPRAIATFTKKNITIVKVACGTNHTVAVDTNGYVYTWGYGGYGRLGHREQKDEWEPRLVEVFQRHNVLPPNALVSAGSANSACTAAGGQLYMWGKLKNTGDDWMYPKPLMDLSGWHIRCMDSGYMFHFCGADNSCISWGHAQHGELGYGPNQQKSSSIPKKVDILENMHIISVACGMGHSLILVDRTNVGEKLDQLAIYDGKNLPEDDVATGDYSPSKKRKKSKNSSDNEDEQEEDDEYSSESGEENGGPVKGQRGGRGRGRGSRGGRKPLAESKSSSGRGRGRPKTVGNVSQSGRGRGKAGKRGKGRK